MEKIITLTLSVNPIPIAQSKAPISVNADLMSDKVLSAKLQKGYKDIETGKETRIIHELK